MRYSHCPPFLLPFFPSAQRSEKFWLLLKLVHSKDVITFRPVCMKHTQNPSSGRFCRNNSENRPKFWDFLPFLPSPWGDFRFFVIPTSRLVNRDNEHPPFYALFQGVLIPFAVRFFIMENRNHPQKAPYCNLLGYLHHKFDFFGWRYEPSACRKRFFAEARERFLPPFGVW